MIWFFHRGSEHLQYEIREAAGSPGYELVVVGPDGVPTVERFADSIGLLERSLELQRSLLSDGWASDRATQSERWRWTVTAGARTRGRKGGKETR